MKFLLKQKKRSAVSPVIATLLLIAIAVAAAIIVYAFVTGLIGGLTSGGSNLVTVSGNLLVPTGTGAGSLVINVKNSGNNPITNIVAWFPGATSVAVPGLFGGPIYVDNPCFGPVPTCGVVATPGAFFTFGPASAIVSAANPVPVGSETSATTAVTAPVATNLESGASYSFTVTVTFSSGSSQTQIISITAQL